MKQIMYFFNRVDLKNNTTSLAVAFVNQSDESKISTKIELIDTKRVIEIGKNVEETISETLNEFHYKYRKRYINEKITSNYEYRD